jgi:hypothetical protein
MEQQQCERSLRLSCGLQIHSDFDFSKSLADRRDSFWHRAICGLGIDFRLRACQPAHFGSLERFIRRSLSSQTIMTMSAFGT